MSIRRADLHGRIVDLDSHLMVPLRDFGDVLGPPGERLAASVASNPAMAPFFDNVAAVEMNEHNIWHTKGTHAPGAHTPDGRLAVMDIMGVDRQLIFPQVLMCGLVWGTDDDALVAMRSYNDHVVRWTQAGGGRLLPTAVLNTHDLEIAVAEAERVIAAGARAVLVGDAIPPGGRSPAAPEVDRLWATLADAGLPVLLHGGLQGGFMSDVWADAPMLQAGGATIGEPVGPHLLATMHLSPVNFLSTLVFGGVLERHPTLAVGVIELGAQWFGPMAELLDNRIRMAANLRRVGMSREVRSAWRGALPLLPSEYLRRQVRVTPFYWEPIADMIERFGMPEVYGFSTDYPHPEGGTDPIGRVFESVARLGDEHIESIFVTSGALLATA